MKKTWLVPSLSSSAIAKLSLFILSNQQKTLISPDGDTKVGKAVSLDVN
jgi:hypothetical protein